MLQKIIILIFVQLTTLVNCTAQNNNNSMRTETPLIYRIKEPKSNTKDSPMLVLLHGHGSNENDLFGFAEKVPDYWTVVSVRGPYKLGPNSFRWYDVGLVNNKIEINIEQEELSRKKLIDLISEISKKYHINKNKIVVAGFSQGANMAQSLGLGEPKIAAGFGVFSGRYVAEFTPFISESEQLQNTKAFLSHGSGDNMLPKAYAEENNNKLKEIGIQVTFSEDINGHSISPKQWNSFLEWLKNFH